jgi:hypothetical protein
MIDSKRNPQSFKVKYILFINKKPLPVTERPHPKKSEESHVSKKENYESVFYLHAIQLPSVSYGD